jgi:hypothetical protein
MRAAPIGLVCLAIAAACSLSLDGEHFVGQAPASDGGPADASTPEDRDPATCGETCAEDHCELSCPDRACDCALDCAATGEVCKAKCEHHDCTIDCRQVDRCEASCKDADCTVDCSGARECTHVKCEDGAGCTLDCSGAEACQFDACDGEVRSCPGGLLACNRACP